jgi:hypothetical protein
MGPFSCFRAVEMRGKLKPSLSASKRSGEARPGSKVMAMMHAVQVVIED